jgi:hypothetical protein
MLLLLLLLIRTTFVVFKLLISSINKQTCTNICFEMSCTTDSTSKIEIPLASIPEEPETERLHKPQENIPIACEVSLQQNHLRWIRRDSAAQFIIRAIVAVILITTVVALFTGDPSKLSTATLAFMNVAKALALNINGTSSSQESVF